jgi:hypothetical protein
MDPRFVGMQALEMAIAVVDDYSETGVETGFGIPNVGYHEGRKVGIKEAFSLIGKYRDLAIESGENMAVFYGALMLSLVHFMGAKVKREPTIELTNINRLDLNKYLLREKLQETGVTEQLTSR